MMSSVASLFVVCGLVLTGTSAEKIADMEQGAEFTKCVTISDYQTKTLADDITLVDRLANGCCPKDSVPGTKLTSGYKSPQIVCGFKADGTIKTSITSGSNAKCEYNKCYVDKQDLACKDGTKQLLNGCCAKTTKAKDGSFPDLCLNYFKTETTSNSDKVNYCTTYHKNYGTVGRAGTKDKADDQKDGKLIPGNVDTYAACAGGSDGGGGGAASTGGASTTGTTNGVDRPAMGVIGLVAVAFAQFVAL